MSRIDPRQNDSRGVAYVVSEYPSTSHTFIRREVRAVRESGMRVSTFSIHRPSQLVSQADRQEAETTVFLRPISVRALLRCHIAAARYSLKGYLQVLAFALRRGEGSPRATLWQLFYFGEAVVLWWHCHQADIGHIHSHFANSGSDVARLAAAFARCGDAGCDWSFTMHGSAEFLDIKGFRLARKVEDAAFVVCISDYCRSQLMWLVDPQHWRKLVVVHCGVETHSSSPLRSHRIGPLRSLKVLTVGRLIPLKGQTLLIEAASLLGARGLDVAIRIVGGGPLEDRLREAADSSDVQGKVSLLGAMGEDDLDPQYEWADVFCLPSMMEGVPVVLMEAMLRGIPVVAPEITGVPELVDDQQSGLLVRPGRADLIAAALERIALEPDLRDRISFKGYQKIRAEFDVAASAEQLACLFGPRLADDRVATDVAA